MITYTTTAIYFDLLKILFTWSTRQLSVSHKITRNRQNNHIGVRINFFWRRMSTTLATNSVGFAEDTDRTRPPARFKWRRFGDEPIAKSKSQFN